MTNTPSFREELVSQIPAVRLLTALDWEYLPLDETLARQWPVGVFANRAEMTNVARYVVNTDEE